MKYVVVAVLCSIVGLTGCASDDPGVTNTEVDVAALPVDDYRAFCEESAELADMAVEKAGGQDGQVSCQDGASGLEAASAVACANSAPPSCMRSDVTACLDAVAEDPCLVHTAAECEAFVACASEDGSVAGLDYLFRYLQDPPANGINF
ncbi:MAG: hypothetical protein OXU20_30015 [Myxococcales bacterium]|nr:hypothetical protein [Myxococcales bacterium]MDD9969507.1 hypothetical protein [Myxococcales bacterium]